MNFHRVFRVCVSVYRISWIYIPHSRCHHFCLGGTTRKDGPHPRVSHHQTTKRFRRRRKPSTGRAIPLAVWTLDPGSLNLSGGGRGGRWVVPGSGREGGRLGVGVKVCFVVFFGRGNMVIMDPEKICLPVIPVSEVKVLVFGFRMFLGGCKF